MTTIALGDEVRVTRVDGRTFAGKLRARTQTSVVLDVTMRSRSTRFPSVEKLVRIASESIQKIEPWNRYAGFTS